MNSKKYVFPALLSGIMALSCGLGFADEPTTPAAPPAEPSAAPAPKTPMKKHHKGGHHHKKMMKKSAATSPVPAAEPTSTPATPETK